MKLIPTEVFKISFPYPRYQYAVSTQVEVDAGKPIEYPNKVGVVLLEKGLVKDPDAKAPRKEKAKAKGKVKSKSKAKPKVTSLFGKKS